MQRRKTSKPLGITVASRSALSRGKCRAPLGCASALPLLGSLLSLAGCGTPPGSFDVEQSAQSKLSNLMALVQFKKMPKQADPADKVICPDIVILDGTADDRVFGSSEHTNANVRYQFSLNDVARDCKVAGNQMTLRIGAAGKVLLGPVGAPGTFNAPIRVAVIQESDQQLVVSKLYRLPVTVPSGATEAPFTLVTEELNIPYAHPNSQHDYMIKVGFDAAGNDKETSHDPGRHRAHRHSKATSD